MKELLEMGDTVLIKMTGLKAFVIGVVIRGENSIEYQLSYFNNNDHKTCWLFHFEVTKYEDNSKPAGFGNFTDTKKLIS